MDSPEALPLEQHWKSQKQAKPKTPEKLQEEGTIVSRLLELAPYCSSISDLARKVDIPYSTIYLLAKEYGIKVTSRSDALIERALEEATLRPNQSLRQLARTLGVAYDNLHWHLSYRNIKLPLVRPPLIRDAVAELAAKGMYMAEIAAELGLTRQRINQVCKDAGIALPDGRYRSKSRPTNTYKKETKNLSDTRKDVDLQRKEENDSKATSSFQEPVFKEFSAIAVNPARGPTQKRGRGRPPKPKVESDEPKRGRGRPRKQALAVRSEPDEAQKNPKAPHPEGPENGESTKSPTQGPGSELPSFGQIAKWLRALADKLDP